MWDRDFDLLSPPQGSWNEVEGPGRGPHGVLVFRVWCAGSVLGPGKAGGWLAGLVPGCVSQDRKASLLVLGKVACL